jgi:hypothetical protein
MRAFLRTAAVGLAVAALTMAATVVPVRADTAGLAVPLNTTMTTLESSANPSVFGQVITLRARTTRVGATGAVTAGSIAFYDGGVLLSTNTVMSGVATLATRNLTVASHTITAEYSGSAADDPSTSAPLTQVVDKATTTITVTQSWTGTSSVYGQRLQYTARVRRAAPANPVVPNVGTVDFYNELTPLALGVPLSSAGTATLVVTDLPVGLHAIHVDYSGSATDLPIHTTVMQTVSPASTSTTLKATPLSTTAGKTVTLTAIVRPVAPGSGVPDGSVALFDGISPIASGTVVSGRLVVTTTSLSVGLHSLTALYSGSGNYLGSTSAPVVVTIS